MHRQTEAPPIGKRTARLFADTLDELRGRDVKPPGIFNNVRERNVTTANLNGSVIRSVHVYAQGKLFLADAEWTPELTTSVSELHL